MADKVIDINTVESKDNQQVKDTKKQGSNKQYKPMLADVIYFLSDYKKGKFTKKDFENFMETIKIKSYLPFELKSNITIGLMVEIGYNVNFTGAMKATALEFNILTKVLLAYTNIEGINEFEGKWDFKHYDLFLETGFVDYILQYCEKDFERFRGIIYRTFSFESNAELINNFINANAIDQSEKLKEAQEFLGGLSSEDKGFLAQIAQVGSPETQAILNFLK